MRRAVDRQWVVGLAVLLLVPAPGQGQDRAAVPFLSGESLWKTYQTEADQLYRRARPDPVAALVREVDPNYDLLVLPRLDDDRNLPAAGKRLVVVADVDRILNIRVFDGDGKIVVDTDEVHRLSISYLRIQLADLWPPHKLTEDEKLSIIATVTSIVDYAIDIKPLLRLNSVEQQVKPIFPAFEAKKTLFRGITEQRVPALPRRMVWDINHLERASMFYEKALRSIEPVRPGDMRHCDVREGQARTKHQLFYFRDHDGDHTLINEALALARDSLGDRRLAQGESYYDVGAAYQLVGELEAAAGQHEAAVTAFNRAVRTFETRRDVWRPGEGGALHSWAAGLPNSDPVKLPLYRKALKALTEKLTQNPGAQDVTLEYQEVIDEYFVLTSIEAGRSNLDDYQAIFISLISVAAATGNLAPREKVKAFEEKCYNAASWVAEAFGGERGHRYAGQALYAWAKRDLAAGEFTMDVAQRFEDAYARLLAASDLAAFRRGERPITWRTKLSRRDLLYDPLTDELEDSVRLNMINLTKDYLTMADRWETRSILRLQRDPADLYGKVSDLSKDAPDPIRFLLQAYVAHHQGDRAHDLKDDLTAITFYQEALKKLEDPNLGRITAREVLTERAEILARLVEVLNKNPKLEQKIDDVKALLNRVSK